MQQATPVSESFSPNVRHLALILGKSEELCAEALRQSNDSFGGAVRLLLSTCETPSEKTHEPKRSMALRARAHSDAMRLESSAQSDMLMNYQELIDENPSYMLADSSTVQAPQRFSRPVGSPLRAKQPDANALGTQSGFAMWTECTGSFDDRVRSMGWFEAEQEEEVLSQLLTAVHARNALCHAVRLLPKVRRACASRVRFSCAVTIANMPANHSVPMCTCRHHARVTARSALLPTARPFVSLSLSWIGRRAL